MTVTANRAWRSSVLAAAVALAVAQGTIAQSPPAATLEMLGSSGTAYDFLAVSADGRHVAFLSEFRYDPADTTGSFDIYVRDRVRGTTALVSASEEGVPGNSSSQRPSISADGRFVAFSSSASNLVPDDTNNVDDIFVHDRDSDENGIFDEPEHTTIARVSVDTDGIEANCVSARPSISANGRYVAFDSCVTNWAVVWGKTLAVQDIFVHDRQRAVTYWVNPATQNSPNRFNNHHSGDASISADGRYVAFGSQATTQPQTLGDFGSSQIFVSDTCLGAPDGCEPATEWASPQVHVDFQPSDAFKPSISADGRSVAFESRSTVLVPGDTNGVTDIFVFDRASRITARVNVSSSGEQAMTVQPSTCSGNLHASISGNGRFVTFDSCANNLVADDTVAPNYQDVFVHDRDSDGDGIFDEPGGFSTALISRNPAGVTADSSSLQPTISRDGRVVAFSSFSRDITPAASPIGIYVWTASNRMPIANAGIDQTVIATGPGGATVTLDASASSDPDGDPLTFTWSGPFGTLTGVSASTTFGVGAHTVTLTVADGRGGTASDTVTVTVISGNVADLSLTGTASPAQVETGHAITYAIAIANNGVADATGVTVSVSIPAHVHFAGATPVACVAPPAGTAGVVTCAVGTVATGGTSSLSIVLVPHDPGTLSLTIAVDGAHVDPTPTNNQINVAVPVSPGPLLLSIVETIVVTDAAAPMPSTLITVTEPIAVTDSASPLPSALIGIVESIAVTDSSVPQPSVRLDVIEQVTVIDNDDVRPAADTTPPVLTLPGRITAAATTGTGAVVTYLATAMDLADGIVAPVCAPVSGAMFPIGSTTVACNARDSHGNTSTGTFTVRVAVGIPWIAGALAQSGRDAQGRYFVDVTLSSGGTGHARAVRITGLNFLTLDGSGTVTYDTQASGRLPIVIGALDIGTSSSIRLYLKVPRSVRRFLAVETGTLETVTGIRLPLLVAQVLDPR